MSLIPACHRRPTPRTARSLAPECEPLEGRALLSAGQVSRRFLLSPIADGKPLAEHIHPHLTIIISGKVQRIPAGIGILPSGNLPIHTHTADGTLHVESTRQLPFRLRDFFTVWGQQFNRNVILGHLAGRGHTITLTV